MRGVDFGGEKGDEMEIKLFKWGNTRRDKDQQWDGYIVMSHPMSMVGLVKDGACERRGEK